MMEHSFNSAVRHRLLLPCLPLEASADTCQCGAPTATLDSHHPFHCTQCSQLVVGRHNDPAAQLRHMLKEAGVSSMLEPLMRPLISNAGAAGRNAQAATRRPPLRKHFGHAMQHALHVQAMRAAMWCA